MKFDSTLPSVIIYNWNCVTAPVPLHLHFLVDSYGRAENCATGSVVFLSQSVTHRWNTNLWNFSMSSENDCGRQCTSAAGELTSCIDRPTSPWLIDVIKHSLHFALFALSLARSVSTHLSTCDITARCASVGLFQCDVLVRPKTSLEYDRKTSWQWNGELAWTRSSFVLPFCVMFFSDYSPAHRCIKHCIRSICPIGACDTLCYDECVQVMQDCLQ